MKRKALIFLCFLSLYFLTACAMAANPMVRAQSTPVPGLPAADLSVASTTAQDDQMEIYLFFRYQQSGLLACENRTISIPKDESAELAVLRQLLVGPQASHTDLVRLIPHNTTVLNVTSTDDSLLITLSEELLNDGIPENWADDPLWKTEAPLRRSLTLQSLVATMTENFSYSYVQVLIAHEQVSNVSTRLDSSYCLNGQNSPSERLYRDESMLMTMQNSALQVLDAWYRRDYERLYQFTAHSQTNDERPPYQDFICELDASMPLTSYTVSAGHSPAGSNRATLTMDLTCTLDNRQVQFSSVVLRLVLEDGIWRVPYTDLKRLMLRTY